MDPLLSASDIDAEREIELVEKAREDVRCGRVVSFEAVRAWVDGLDTPHELPPPRSR